MDATKYKYDAFISYRHMPTDQKIAKKLQNILERFTPPYQSNAGRHNKGNEKQKKLSLYLDESEYSAGGDLYKKINAYLAQSRYLIFICSKETKDSDTCMYEIRRFKEMHKGKLDHVLVVLLEGNPDDALPEELTYENYEIHRPDGSFIIERHPVNLIRCDIKADNEKAMLKQLKNQFLRLAAPLYNCEYDDLFQRQLKREAKTKVFFSIACMFAVFAVSTFLFWLYINRNSQAITYELAAQSSIEKEDWAQALMYYGKALEMDPSRKTSQTGALLLLQQHTWPCLVKEEENISIKGNILYPHYYQDERIDNYSHYCLSTTPAGNNMLWMIDGSTDDYLVTDKDTNPLYTLKQMGDALYTNDLLPYWTFYNFDRKAFTFYWPEDHQQYEFIWDKPNFGYINIPIVRSLDQKRVVINDNRNIYLYELSAQGSREVMQIPLIKLFKNAIKKCGVDAWKDVYSDLWLSADGSRLAVYAEIIWPGNDTAYCCWSGIALYDTKTMELLTVIENYENILNDVIFSSDGKYLCVLYNNQGSNFLTRGGYAAIYDQNGTPLFNTKNDAAFIPQGASFCNQTLLIWDYDALHFWDITSARECAVPIQRKGNIQGAAIIDDALFAIVWGNNVHYYKLVNFEEKLPIELQSYEIEETKMTPLDEPFQITDELYICTKDRKTVLLCDEDSNVYDTVAYSTNENMPLITNMIYYPNIDSLILLDEQDNLYCFTLEIDKKQFLDVDKIYSQDSTGSICAGKSGILYWNYYTNNILYTTTDWFDPYPHYYGWMVTPENSGVFLGMTSDLSDYVAFVIDDSINNQTIIEIHEMKEGKYLNKYTLDEDHPWEDILFVSDGLLGYKSNNETFFIQIGCTKPNSQTIGQLLDISGCTIDNNQLITANPVIVDPDNFGNWSDILTWTSE